MTNFRTLAILLLALVSVVACSQTAASADALAPPTPAMPSHWRVISDINFAAADIRPVSANLGAKISALRNTTYDAGGRTIKLNTIVAATSGDADSITEALWKTKPEQWFLRRGLLIYEFVASNDAIPELHKGRALLLAHSH
jgi:hypothetical protein